MLKVGFFGESGSFSESAARGHFGLYEPKSKVEFLSFPNTEDLLEVLVRQKIDKAVFPIENSIEGIVTSTADVLIGNSKIVIEGEVNLLIRHNIIGVGLISEIEEVISHPQALAQCRKSIRRIGASLKTRVSSSTSAAVKEVAEGDNPKIAAIGSFFAFEIYQPQNSKLKILAESMQDIKNNRTRFLIMGHENKPRTGNDKTSIIVLPDKNIPGALHQILGEFADRDIDLTKIESRPTKKVLGEYLFYIDCKGHKDDRIIRDALTAVKKKSRKMKMLGSYPRAE